MEMDSFVFIIANRLVGVSKVHVFEVIDGDVVQVAQIKQNALGSLRHSKCGRVDSGVNVQCKSRVV